MSAPLACVVDTASRHTSALVALLEEVGFDVKVCTEINGAGQEAKVWFLSMDLPDANLTRWIDKASQGERSEVFLMAQEDDAPRVRQAIAQGATYFFCKPFDAGFLQPLLADLYEEATHTIALQDEQDIEPLDQFGELRGSSVPMRKLYRLLRKVAPTDASILLVGESGTGKELVARTLHQMSEAASGPFQAMNCAAIPKELFESELFGHEKGSFSGAQRQHRGFFERAQGGTLFFDELAEMPIELQAKLLRVLEVGAYRRVGGETDLKSQVRIIAATNRDPQDAIADNLLREDLYYRIARFPIFLPPLRARQGDIPGLAQYFIDALNQRNDQSITLSVAALEQLACHDWPGNVRELRSAIEQAYILADSEITPAHLPASETDTVSETLDITVGETVDEAERKLILATLEANGDDKQAAADMLGMSLRTLYNRLNTYENPDAADALKSKPGK
ncbi:MAG: sigma 54-interacting transcriptional regulator [bacterium]